MMITPNGLLILDMQTKVRRYSSITSFLLELAAQIAK
jgi:hypothetical protein